jgi:type IV secretion system protein VirB9
VKLLLFFLIGLAAVAPASGQVRPQPGSGDPRLQTIDYDPDAIVELTGSPGYELTVELSPDERVQNVAVGDASAWQVSVNHAGDHLFIKPTQGGVRTNMTVITSIRVYNFELYPLFSPSPDMAYNVRFNYPAKAAGPAESDYVDVSPLRRAMSRYRISGDRTIRPESISDDGTHTYISWSRSKPIPAVYAISDGGEEALVSGWMRDDVYVIDGILNRLVFRIDRKTAHAERLAPRKKP